MSTWVASLASTLALLAFVFDMIAFTIAKSRLNSANTGSDAKLQASLGNGIWLTLVGFILLFLSSCFFGFGTRMSNRRPRQSDRDAMRPRIDANYAAEARRDAQQLEMAERARRAGGGGGNNGLPAFPEEERIPLTALPNQRENHSDESFDSQTIQGVGTGYGYGPGAANENAAGVGAGAGHQADDYPQTAPYESRTETPGSHYRPYTTRRGSASTGLAYTREDPYETSQQQQQQGYNSAPAPVNFPTAGQYGGREPSQYQPRSNPLYQSTRRETSPYQPSANPLYQSVPTYPPPIQPPSSVPPRPATAAYSGNMNHYQSTPRPSTTAYSSNAAYPQSTPTPWIPPVDTGAAIPLPQGQGSFHTAAAAARHRPPTSNNNHASYPQAYNAYQPDHSNAPSQGDRFTSHRAVSGNTPNPPASATVASPPYDDYEYYSLESPVDNNPLVSIPYAPTPSQPQSHTPIPTYRAQSTAPTYSTREPYPSYGGELYR